MERLTRRMCGRWGVVEGCELNTLNGMRRIVDRLAAYENTGLSPEEIQQTAERGPLTLEDLRAMDGQPVWAEKSGHESRWALVYNFWTAEDVIFLIFNNGKQEHANFLLDEGWKIYRRPPHSGPDAGWHQN